jgi:hypothetical protein
MPRRSNPQAQAALKEIVKIAKSLRKQYPDKYGPKVVRGYNLAVAEAAKQYRSKK